MDVATQLQKTKKASYTLAHLDESKRNELLATVANNLLQSIPEILIANAKDLENMSSKDSMYDRLVLTEARIKTIADDINSVIKLTSPINTILEHRVMPNGLDIQKITVPLGVVAVIYESRPNVTIDVFTLCFKAGNACILKGGKEAYHSNLVLVQIIQKALETHNIDMHAICFFPPSREDMLLLLSATGLVDVCIPRGSQALINFVRDNAKIPVIETGSGIVHAYFDLAGDLAIGRSIINNSKTRRVSVCNALDCLLMHQARINDLASLVEPLQQHNVEIFADPASYAALLNVYPQQLLHQARKDEFGREFLDYKLAVKIVRSAADAIDHISSYSSGHSEAIITDDKKTAQYFVDHVDAAAVYVNASTAFTDGAQFGLGAEIGISTQKLHARGPMGLEALTSYKWIVHGNGQVRS
jgi:glutamate-5-semialdehyde dehydrogenase